MTRGCRCYRCRARDAARLEASFAALMAANGPWLSWDAGSFDAIVESAVSQYGVSR